MTSGLRERKKQRTREQIAEAARELFTEHGFDRVTVAQVARAAEVSEQTVFNYFATKEDLVYWRLATIRDRGEGESVLAAFRRFLLAQGGLLGRHDAAAREQLTSFTRMIVSSPALQAREAQILEGYTASLAALIAEETAAPPGDIRPAAVANALMGVHRALIAHTRSRIVAGGLKPSLPRSVRAQAEHAFDLLEGGLGDYGRRRPPRG